VRENVKLSMDSKHGGERMPETSHGGAISSNLEETKASVKFSRGAISGLIPIKSLVSVSWHVPHRNRDEHPGFYSDYSRPRTRPPSHN
ncbi:unnamed protein product, partial [Ilex paraguariensis]